MIEMLEFLNNIDPVVLDAIVISILVLIASLGAVRGIKKVSMNVFLLSASLFLAFSPWMNSVKKIIIENLLDANKLAPSGSSDAVKLAITLLTPLLAALILFILLHLILCMISTLIQMMIKRKKKGEFKAKSALGRVFAGLISLLYGGTLLIVVLFVSRTNLVGLKNPIESSSVTKTILDNATKLTDKIEKDFDKKLIIKIYNGNVLYEADEELMNSFQYLEDNIVKFVKDKEYVDKIDGTLTKEESGNLIKERITDLHNLAIICIKTSNEYNDIKSYFVKFAQETIAGIHGKVKTNGIDKVEYTLEEYSIIRKTLKDAGVSDETLVLFEEIAVGK